MATYDEAWAATDVEPTDMTELGLPTFVHFGHPAACTALTAAATEAGATVHHGAKVTDLSFGDRPTVSFRDVEGAEHRFACRMIIGADGRASAVRRRAGFMVRESPTLVSGGGVLVHGDSWPAELLALVTEGDLHYVIAPRAGANRLYVFCTPDVARARFSGSHRTAALLDAYHLRSVPFVGAFAHAVPAGPSAFFAMTDTWVDDPVRDGVALVGDAAGWNNPLIGQGLAIALRDVRHVVGVLTSNERWSPEEFHEYRDERRERMRRLRATAFVDACISVSFDSAARERRAAFRDSLADPVASAYVLGRAIGVDDLPAAAYEEDFIAEVVGRDHPYLDALPSFGLGTDHLAGRSEPSFSR
ncbi:MAG: NAD(P)/FAD-dependent oxidoreductase [Acidimicrobiia bacterium]